MHPFEAKVFMRKKGSNSVFFAHTVNLFHTENTIPADKDVIEALEKEGYEVHHIEYCVRQAGGDNPVTVTGIGSNIGKDLEWREV